MAVHTAIQRADIARARAKWDNRDDIQWIEIHVPPYKGHVNAEHTVTFFGACPRDAGRLGRDLLEAMGQQVAEDIVEMVCPPIVVSEQRLDPQDWNEVITIVNEWAYRQPRDPNDSETQVLALAWLAIDEQVQADATELYLGAVHDGAQVAFSQ